LRGFLAKIAGSARIYNFTDVNVHELHMHLIAISEQE
jgi:hypothetical protein